MPKVSFAFFATGCVFVLAGMAMGTWMGATEKFTLSPVHAHLNLIGWASMAIMGGFYALAKDLAPRRLAWINYGLMTAAVIGMTPSLGFMLLGDKSLLPVLIVSEFLAIGGAAMFLVSVLVAWRRSGRPVEPSKSMPGLGAIQPAE